MKKVAVKPLWSWNDKLEKQELLNQIEQMKNSGIDGFFMHARGGLITDYLSDEWLELTKACMDKADELGMEAWAYDENGWPSGFANGIVPKHGEDFCQKWLVRAVIEDEIPKNSIAFFRKKDGEYVYVTKPQKGDTVIKYEVNYYYTDALNKEAIKYFLDNTHEKYYEKMGENFGKSLKGFFTDEPQYGNGGPIPWSNGLTDEFFERYSYDLRDRLILLFIDSKDAASFRFDYYSMVSDIFKQSFIKQMYDWCEAHNCKLTGHMMGEETLTSQMHSTGGVMSCYEYFHEPGMDWLGRKIASPMVPKQLGSVAAQLGRKTMTESFALCGWDVSLNELKWIAQWQYVNGVTSLCPHLEGYSMRGYRKRDYPASLFTQLPWFDKGCKPFCEYFRSLGKFLDETTEYAPLLVLHPMTSAYIVYNPEKQDKIEKLSDYFDRSAQNLNELHIPYHFGDETILNNYAVIKNKTVSVGKCDYNYLLLDNIINITSSTLDLITEFIKNGGVVYVCGKLPTLVDGRKNDSLEKLSKSVVYIKSFSELKEKLSIFTIDNPAVHCTTRINDKGERFCYLVNLSSEPQTAKVSANENLIISSFDVESQKETVFDCRYDNGKTEIGLDFEKYGSFVLKSVEGCAQNVSVPEKEYIKLDNTFTIKSSSPNCITLDKCEYRIDGGKWQDEIAVILLQEKLLEGRNNCKLDMRFHFKTENGFVPRLSLCVETPNKYSFTVNGKRISFVDRGFFIDRSIRKADISDYVVSGENEIVISGEFYQSDNVFHILFDEGIHESEKNKLTYDTELESIYLVGDFAVCCDDEYRLGDKRCIFSCKDYYLAPSKNTVRADNITVQGYYFFSGWMNLSQKVSIEKRENIRYAIKLNNLICPAAELFVNGQKAGDFNFAPFEIDVTDHIINGENEIDIKLLSGNRNVFGPHHRPYGESYFVGPATFTDKEGWTDVGLDPWTDNYSFVLFGLVI